VVASSDWILGGNIKTEHFRLIVLERLEKCGNKKSPNQCPAGDR
jgi:hypothetical protein